MEENTSENSPGNKDFVTQELTDGFSRGINWEVKNAPIRRVKSRASGTAAAPNGIITISDLNLDKDLHYKILLVANLDAAGNINLQLNGDITMANYFAQRTINGATAVNAVTASGLLLNGVTGGAGDYIFEIDIMQTTSGVVKMVKWTGGEAVTATAAATTAGGGYYNQTTNLTSILIQEGGGTANMIYSVYIMKANPNQ